MPILNYTTKIEAAKTVGEIQAMLIKKGALGIMVKYENQQPVAIQFEIDTQAMGVQYFRYEVNVAGVLAAMKKDRQVPNAACHTEQARRVAWRIEKDWLEAMFAKIDATGMPLEQIFMPYMLNADGRPIFQLMCDKYKALPAPQGD